MSDLPSPQKTLLPRFLRKFIETESSSGILMLIVTALALLAANSSLSDGYVSLIHAPLRIGYGNTVAAAPLSAWIKDVLMVFFFLVVGMELKRERCEGFLAQRDQLLLPLVAAVGGMVLPALIFFAVNHAHPSHIVGWAIPSATDIAFALCVLTLVGRGIPPAIKIFLLAIAIFDDLGAILIIALFYGHPLALQPLGLAMVGVAALVWLNRRQVAALFPYMLTGIYLWFCLKHGGIHTTLAGVMVGMAIPMRSRRASGHSPLHRAISLLHPWVSFIVLPLFAFTSAGVRFIDLGIADVFEPLPLGIACGLFFGKQIGIFGTSWALIALRLARKPEGVSWRQIYGVSILAGIGFTMSLFIGLLAFSDVHLQEMVKIGVIGGSLLSALWGFFILRTGARASLSSAKVH